MALSHSPTDNRLSIGKQVGTANQDLPVVKLGQVRVVDGSGADPTASSHRGLRSGCRVPGCSSNCAKRPVPRRPASRSSLARLAPSLEVKPPRCPSSRARWYRRIGASMMLGGHGHSSSAMTTLREPSMCARGFRSTFQTMGSCGCRDTATLPRCGCLEVALHLLHRLDVDEGGGGRGGGGGGEEGKVRVRCNKSRVAGRDPPSPPRHQQRAREGKETRQRAHARGQASPVLLRHRHSIPSRPDATPPPPRPKVSVARCSDNCISAWPLVVDLVPRCAHGIGTSIAILDESQTRQTQTQT